MYGARYGRVYNAPKKILEQTGQSEMDRLGAHYRVLQTTQGTSALANSEDNMKDFTSIYQPQGYLVWDEFLQRRQIRFISTAEFIELAAKTPGCLDEMATLWEVVNPAALTTILPSYGRKEWR